jgi:uncharacterized membrane protein
MIKNRIRFSSVILAALGIIDSLYLTWVKITANPALCIKGLGNCVTVNSSKYSELFGIPIALLGALTYIVILACLLLENRYKFFADNGIYAVFGFSLFGTAFSIYLTYIEFAVIRATCPYCLTSAITILVIFVLSIIRLAVDQDQ